MSQSSNMALRGQKTISREELLALKQEMNAKALTKRRIRTGGLLAGNIVFAILILLPLLYAISIAFMPSGELFTTELNLFPKNPTIKNFVDAFTTIPLLRFVLNSFIMAGSITIAQIITCSLAAFAFSFLEFKGRNVLFMIVLATMMVPSEATIVSNYLTVGNLGMLDTYPVLIVPYLTSAMGIFLFRQFYMSFPISLYESAFQQYENGADRYQYAQQCGFPVHHHDDRRCGNGYHPINRDLYRRTETADPGYVLRCGERLSDKKEKESKNEEKNRFIIINRCYGSRYAGRLRRRTEHC